MCLKDSISAVDSCVVEVDAAMNGFGYPPRASRIVLIASIMPSKKSTFRVSKYVSRETPWNENLIEDNPASTRSHAKSHVIFEPLVLTCVRRPTSEAARINDTSFGCR